MSVYILDQKPMNLNDVGALLSSSVKLELSSETVNAIQKARSYLDTTLKNSGKLVYGINTGFGALYNIAINEHDLEELQANLVKSHACGMGETIPLPMVKLMLLLKIHALSYGLSGVQVETVQRLIDFYNADVLPVIFEQGSLGASGDLAPLAHLSLPLLGLGECWLNGKRTSSKVVLDSLGWKPIKLQSKEGLALLNGTQFMSAYGVYLSLESHRLFNWAKALSALSLDAFDGRIEPFHSRLQEIRNHQGQQEVAESVRNWLNGSNLITREKEHVQDPYSFRCVPQVLGASIDVLKHVEQVFTNELNAVTDNPTIFPEEDMILSGGNFHGQPLALALDYLCLALHEVGSISERRVYQLISGKRNLPQFLVSNPGFNSGLMIPQYTAASIVSQNKQLCTPASIDTIDSSAGQEDHVSMGANAATKALRVLQNLERILAVELFTAAQAIEFRRPDSSSPALESLLKAYRTRVSFIEDDRIYHYDLEKSVEFIKTYSLPVL
jgi:histidine ammonia-lyase